MADLEASNGTDGTTGTAGTDGTTDTDGTSGTGSATPAPAPAPPVESRGSRAQPKTDKSEATRALILETAMQLFQEHGYDKTTMRAIATEAGVSVGNAYYYFSPKEWQPNSSRTVSNVHIHKGTARGALAAAR